MELKILDPRIGTNFPAPEFGTDGSAGVDLVACLDDVCSMLPGDCKFINTGIAIYIKDKNIAGIVLPRSGLGHKGLVLGNGTGLIDSDYQGELKMSVWNRGTETIEINPGSRIAQIIFVVITRPSFVVVEEFKKTKRGDGGFGHTGI